MEFANQGSNTNIGKTRSELEQASTNAGLSCNLNPFLNQWIDERLEPVFMRIKVNIINIVKEIVTIFSPKNLLMQILCELEQKWEGEKSEKWEQTSSILHNTGHSAVLSSLCSSVRAVCGRSAVATI